ncbi:hypothetical protein PHYSODRAFT_383895 [Rhizophagus clarus]|uniref:DDE-1 domain-containing protein n=1 Tax=Rhizophagus clarus TaxID=94130 RepID=A0A8H3LC56_9GLOM|nr:hypothetical protein PHYSODRAFT_383895 [Rhizophagus clarus]
MEPNQTLSTSIIAGRKMDKSRVFILFYANATGFHKICPLIIGKSLNPQLNRKVLLFIDNAGFHFNSKKFKKDSDIDNNKISESDEEQESKKQKEKEKPAIDFTNIELIYFLPNMIAHL